MFVSKKRPDWSTRDPEIVVYHDGDGEVSAPEDHDGGLPPGATGQIEVWLRQMTGADVRYIQDQTAEVTGKGKDETLALRTGKGNRSKVVRQVEHIRGYGVERDGQAVEITTVSGSVYDEMPAFLCNAIIAGIARMETAKGDESGE